MKAILVATVTFLSLALLADTALAQSKRKSTETGAVSGRTCTTGQTCSANCDALGWCSRMVCSGNKWEKRLVSCVGFLCPPKC